VPKIKIKYYVINTDYFQIWRSRKRKSSLSNGTNGIHDHHGDAISHRSDVIAVGTSSGAVLIYSLKTGDVTAQFVADKAHAGRINDIVSCSDILDQWRKGK